MDREKLVEAIRLKIAETQFGCNEDGHEAMLCIRRGSHVDGTNPCACWEAARAALAVAEPAVRADERLACLNVAHRWTRDGHSATAHGIILGIEERTGGTP